MSAAVGVLLAGRGPCFWLLLLAALSGGGPGFDPWSTISGHLGMGLAGHLGGSWLALLGSSGLFGVFCGIFSGMAVDHLGPSGAICAQGCDIFVVCLALCLASGASRARDDDLASCFLGGLRLTRPYDRPRLPCCLSGSRVVRFGLFCPES